MRELTACVCGLSRLESASQAAMVLSYEAMADERSGPVEPGGHFLRVYLQRLRENSSHIFLSRLGHHFADGGSDRTLCAYDREIARQTAEDHSPAL